MLQQGSWDFCQGNALSNMQMLYSFCLLQHTLAMTLGIKQLFPILFNSRYVSARRYQVVVYLCFQCAWCTAHRCFKTTGFKIHHLFTITALAVALLFSALALHMQASGWIFTGFFAGEAPGGLALLGRSWLLAGGRGWHCYSNRHLGNGEVWKCQSSGILSHFLSRLAQFGIQPWHGNPK